MEREALIYIGNAAHFSPNNLYRLDGYTVTDAGEVICNGTRLKEYSNKGYKYVEVIINGKVKKCKVHRIVATTFSDICGEFNEVVNHLDENTENNSAANLRWTTNKINLSWGNIKGKQNTTKALYKEIRETVRSFYLKEGYNPPKKIKVTEIKTCFRAVTDDGSKFYTIGKSTEIDRTRTSFTPDKKIGKYYYNDGEISEKLNNTKVIHLFRRK